MSTQTHQEKLALDAAWQAHPKVVAFKAANAAFAATLPQDMPLVDAMNATLRFGSGWLAENGELPPSGVLCDG